MKRHYKPSVNNLCILLAPNVNTHESEQHAQNVYCMLIGPFHINPVIFFNFINYGILSFSIISFYSCIISFGYNTFINNVRTITKSEILEQQMKRRDSILTAGVVLRILLQWRITPEN